MVWIPGNTFWMGSDEFYPEERPVHQKHVDGFFIDTHPVTVAEFRRFVKSTGYVTTAETTPEEADYPGADPALLVPGSLVFTPPPGPVPLDDYLRWWTWTPGADWRHPEVLVAISQGGSGIRSHTSRTSMRSPTRTGRQGPPHRGGMGVRGTRRSRSCAVRLGR